MVFKTIYIAILLTIVFHPALIADEVNYKDYSNSFGIKASNISGYGFYYNKSISQDFNLQFMGLIYYYENKKENEEYSNFNYDFGLEIQRNMYKGKASRFYLLAGAYYYHDNEYDKTLLQSREVDNDSYNVGVGAAYELFYKRFVLSMDIGYKFFEDNKEITEDLKPTYPARERTTKIGVGIGIGFTF